MNDVDLEDIYELSPMQQGMLFQHLYSRDADAYVNQVGVDVEGQLDADAVRQALRHVVNRHAVLRTSFVWQGVEQPYQVVHRAVQPALECLDFSAAAQAERAARFDQWLEADRRAGFDLREAPLLRVTMIALGPAETRLMWTFHHIVLEGLSFSIVLGEFWRILGGVLQGAVPDLPQPRPYGTYIEWLRGRDRWQAERYWRRTLAGIGETTHLVLDRDPGGERTTAAGVQERALAVPTSCLAGLRELARSRRLTLNTLIQGAVAILASCYSESRDVLFGEVVSGRPEDLPDAHAIVGMFVNTLPARISVDAQAPLTAWLETMQRERAQMREYSWCSLVDVQGWSEIPRGQPLFDLLYVFENQYYDAAAASVPAGGIALRKFHVWKSSDLPLTIDVFAGQDPLKIVAFFDPRRYGAHDVERLLEELGALLERFVATPDCRVGELFSLCGGAQAVLPAAMRRQLLQEWNATAADYPRERGVHELIEAQVRRTPQRVAVVHEGVQLSYAELDARANAIARRLRARGAGRGTRVGICLERGVNMLAALLGILKSGAAYVPLDPGFPSERLRYMAQDAELALLVSTRSLAALVGMDEAQHVLLDADAPGIEAPSAAAEPQGAAHGEDPAYLIYTSGSTGRPKGVVVPHRAVVNFLTSMAREPGLRQDDVLLAVTTLSFDIAVLELLLPLVAGARVVIATREDGLDGRALARRLQEHGASVMQATPATWRLLVEAGWSPRPGFKALTGGEALARDLAGQLLARGVELWNMYGPTETTVWSTCARIAAAAAPITIGRPIANTVVRVLDATGALCAVGVPGELCIGGDGVSLGYWKQPELTAEKFVADPFDAAPGAKLYRTGDRARWREDGCLEHLGRLDDQVKIRGYRIELGEIEEVLRTHEQVTQAVVASRKIGTEPRLVAYVVGATRVARALDAYLRERLPAYMLPSAWMFLDALPLTPNGKVDRRALPAPATLGLGRAEYIAPRSPTERMIADIWCEVLGVERVAVHDGFFELGGHSLQLMTVAARLETVLKRSVAVTDLFRYPTVQALARFLDGNRSEDSGIIESARQRAARGRTQSPAAEPIAIVAMAGRFPGAADLDAYWRNLAAGAEAIRFFERAELFEAGVSPDLLADPSLVPARGMLENIEAFDADFFGYSPREAELLDPQQRIFLECAWEALERAGYDPLHIDAPVGVYAGATPSQYQLALMSRPDIVRSVGAQGLMGNDGDFLPMRVSYKLDLRGPSVNVQSTCSTSLVAVHEACKALWAFECDMALAGGVTALAERVGVYRYQEGGILSPDGHCRPFDARARGTVFGEGVGVVVLKRLSDALAAGDPIRAVIRGTAVNNDGADKVGFTAPSVSAQARLVAAAHAAAGVDAASIGYVEAHGTGTALGDPIELAALRLAFAEVSGKRCAIGSVKANIGHLDRAAGVAGLIKTVLMLERAMLPPAVNFETPHPELESGPFYVNTRLTPWERSDGTPRRAGVSSFGMGGTNAHVVLEEAPPVQPSGPSRPKQLLLLSARSEAALAAMRENLAAHLEAHPETNLADVAHTLRTGRTPFAHRRAFVCSNVAEAIEALRAPGGRTTVAPDASRPVVFMLPGQGAQHPNMGRALYESEAGYREALDACCEHLNARLDLDLRQLLFPASGEEEAAARRLERTALAQPALFATEYALARLLAGWGIRPAAMIGHSVGELVAACLAGVLALEDALALVAERGRVMEAAREGAMLSVALSADAASAYTGEDVWLAAVNAETACALACTLDGVSRLEARLAADGVQYRRLRTSHAFHSALMEPAMAPLREFARGMRLGAIDVPYISNVSGTWVDSAMLADGSYWSRHLREPVLFHQGIERLLQDVESAVLLEVGPGRALRQLARAPASRRGFAVATTLGAAGGDGADAQLTRALGELWTCGAAIDWKAYCAGERRRRVELPPYPFQRKRYWVTRDDTAAANRPALAGGTVRKADLADWFSVPTWQRTLASAGADAGKRAPGAENWLVFADACGLGRALGMRLRNEGHRVAFVVPGAAYTAAPGEYTIRPADASDYDALFDDLDARAMRPQRIVHAWAVTGRDELDANVLDERCFVAPLRLVQCLGRRASVRGLRIDMLADEMHEVTGSEAIRPEKSLLLGPCRVAPLEHAGLSFRGIDLPRWSDEPAARQALVDTLLGELRLDDPAEPLIAYRNGYRWLPRLAPAPLPAPAGPPLPRLRERGVYLVTGGLGGIGLCIADYLAQAVRAQLVLVGRSGLPPRDKWDAYLESHEASEPTARRILAVRGLIAKGAKVRVEAADVADRGQMTAVMQRIRDEFGALHGVVHAAGMPGGGLIQLKTREAADAVLRPKVEGTRVLAELLRESPPDFVLLCSSINALAGAPGQVDYTAANAFLDAFALTQRGRAGTYTVSVNWDTWREVGMAVETVVPGALAARRDASLSAGIGNAEGVEAFRRILASALPQVVVSPRVMERASAVVSTPEADADVAGSAYERPDLDVEYVAPRDEIEQRIARMWSEYLGIARVGVHDDFLDLGGHSLLATRLLGRLRDELGAGHLTLEDILAEPTVAGIARRIRDGGRSSGPMGVAPATPAMHEAPSPPAGAAPKSETTSQGSAADLLARVYAASSGRSRTGQ